MTYLVLDYWNDVVAREIAAMKEKESGKSKMCDIDQVVFTDLTSGEALLQRFHQSISLIGRPGTRISFSLLYRICNARYQRLKLL